MTWQAHLMQEITQSGAIIWFFLQSSYSNRFRTHGRVKFTKQDVENLCLNFFINQSTRSLKK